MPRSTTASEPCGPATGVSATALSADMGALHPGTRNRSGTKLYRLVPNRSRSSQKLRRGWHRDGSVDDLCLELLDLCLVRVERRVRGCVADAVLLQTESRGAGLEGTVHVVLDERVGGRVNALERGREDVLL